MVLVPGIMLLRNPSVRSLSLGLEPLGIWTRPIGCLVLYLLWVGRGSYSFVIELLFRNEGDGDFEPVAFESFHHVRNTLVDDVIGVNGASAADVVARGLDDRDLYKEVIVLVILIRESASKNEEQIEYGSGISYPNVHNILVAADMLVVFIMIDLCYV
jgi:hypothetical protein